ncbi:probable DDB1- and CUL4-associated factor 1 [Coccomyxa sp. Obi]|nr:probable DDB1- and CUL4-associated factor 1 [Coccomyxa sp. Obi]
MQEVVAFHASAALRQYFRTHLVLHVTTLKRRYCGHNAVKHGASAAERTVDVSAESVDAAVSAVENDWRVGEAFVRERWPPLEKFMRGGGPSLMLDLVQHTPGERYCNEIARHALEILQIATLMPECRRSLLTATDAQAGGHTDGIAAILEAAHGQAYLNDPEVMQPALVVLANCVTVPSSLAHLHPLPDKASSRRKPAKSLLPAPLFTPQPQPGSSMDLDLQSHSSAEGDLVAAEMREGYAAARQAVRRAAGIRMLLGLLHARSSMPAGQVDRLRALAVRCLLGLAHEPQLRHILAKLQVWRLLAQLVHEPDRGTISNGSASRRLIGTEASSSSNSLATFNSLAIDLINLTSAGLGKAGAAAAASDAVAPALHKIERAAIAASTHITYAPSELLVLIEDHLRASGLHASADALAAEAALGTSQTSAQADCPSDTHQQQLTTPFACTPALMPADSPFPHPGMQSSAAKRRALAIAPALIKSIVKAPAIARDLSACAKGVDAFGVMPEECIPGSPPAALDAAHSSRLADHLSTAGRTPAAALQSRRKRRAAESLPGSTPHRQRCGGDMIQPEQPCTASSEDCIMREDAATAAHAEMPVPAASQPLTVAPPLVTPARLRGLFGTMDRLGCTPSAAAGTAANPLLLNLPNRRKHVPNTAQPCSTPCLPKATTKHAISSPPDRKGHGAGTDTPVASKLSSIVMQYLRHQHKAACLKAAAPISTLPPMSLLRPNTLPQAKRTLEAPSQVHRRLLRRSVTDPHGGWGGRRQDRHFIYSRFRHLRSVRDEDSAVYRSCAFLGNFAALALGTHSGEIRIHDTLSGDLIDTIDAHDTPAYQLRVFEGSGRSLLLSSARADTRLWDVGACNDCAGALWSPAEYVTEPLHSCDGMRSAIFRPDGRMIAGLVASGRGQDPLLFDLGSETYSTISMTDEGWRSKGMETLCFNPTGELLLFGPTLWDPRAPRCIHVFDLLSYSACCSSFHPAGLEAVVNSEVWDLRTLKLQRCVPCLDSTSLTWNASGDCAYATLRRPSDDLGALLNPKRAKQPLHAAFRTVDATDFSEIGTISTEGRCVLDLCVDAADNYIGLVTLEPNELMSCSARVYEVGRRRMQDDDSDLEDGDVDDEEDEDDEEEEEEEEGAQLITSGPSRSSSLAEDASAEGDGEDGEAGSENGNSEEEEEEAGSADEDADEEGEEDGDSDEDEEGSADEEVGEGGEEVEDDDVEAYVRLIGRLREFAGDQSGLESEEDADMSDSNSD